MFKLRKIILFAVIALTIIFFTSQTTPRANVQEVRVSAGNTAAVNGFRSGTANYEIVNLPQVNRTNVIKVNGANCQWNILNYSLANFRGRKITINFSVDVMRLGSNGTLNWMINNEPDYPSIVRIDNAESGVWYNTNGRMTIIPTHREPFLYLAAWENNFQTASFYFDNIKITIDTWSWDYTPTTTVGIVGEADINNTRNIYVSASRGSDSGNGTQARPFQKIANAMHYARQGDTVLVDSGTYYERFRIPTGAAGRPITLTAMPEAEVIITPTIPISPQWRQLGTSGVNRNIWVADISEYVKDIDTEFPQLFANRDSMVEARFPNMGALCLL
ncbi:MAG: hypothetical protein FWD47_13195 [Treponema sp.]|nr:hypothetical protein [Treponema sp.]